MPGCLGERNNCEDIPKGAIPPCTGTHVREIMKTQAELAEADDFVIYEHEWLYDPVALCGSIRPGPYGSYHLTQIAKRLPTAPFPVLIQVNPDDRLNEGRRVVVVQYLKANGIEDAETRVIIGFPQAEPLYGEEAVGTFRQGYIYPWVNGARGGYGGYGGGAGGYGGIGGGVGGYGGIGGGTGGILGGLGGMGGLRAY
jgi:hypothetical protein